MNPARTIVRAWRGETGATITELAVVVAIMGILIGIGIPQFTGARNSVNTNDVTNTAEVYRKAIVAFQLDHGNRVPTFGNPVDWPLPMNGIGDDGPREPGLRAQSGQAGRKYILHQPKNVASGRVVVSDQAPTNAQPTRTRGWIQYMPIADAAGNYAWFWLGVYVRREGETDFRLHCATGFIDRTRTSATVPAATGCGASNSSLNGA